MNTEKPNVILIINVHSTMNSGDAALLWLNARQLLTAFPGVSIKAMVNYPNDSIFAGEMKIEVLPSPFALLGDNNIQSDFKKAIKLLYGCLLILIGSILPDSILREIHSDWLQIVRNYQTADIVAAVSGAQMVSLGKYSWPMIVSSLPILMAHYFQKPLYIMPQSVGPFRWRWERKLLKFIYSRARLVLVRDAISLKLLKDISIPEKKVRFASDPGFSLPPVPSEIALEIMQEFDYSTDQKAIGITIISQLSKSFKGDQISSYYQVFADALTQFSHEFETRIYIFDQVTGPTPKEDDSIASERFIELMRDQQIGVVHVNRRLNPMELKACYSLMDMFIATRLHSGIFAMASGVPTIFIGYNPKTRGVLEAAGLEKQVIELHDLDKIRLLELLRQTWQNRREITEKTLESVKKSQEDDLLVPQWIAEDYFSARKS